MAGGLRPLRPVFHPHGLAHGAADPGEHVGNAPAAAGIEEQGLGWKNSFGTGNAGDTITSGLEGAWSNTPTQWSNSYFENLFGYDWELTKSAAGAQQWKPKGSAGAGTVPDVHDPAKRHAPIMFTSDIALKVDPIYAPVSKRFFENPDQFADAFARAWFKLTHRDMGPKVRYLGPEVPTEELLWQDPVPAVTHPLIDHNDVAALKAKILGSGQSVSDLVSAAWASASTFRGSDMRGGADGARLRLAPQQYWQVNNPALLSPTLQALEGSAEEMLVDKAQLMTLTPPEMTVLVGGMRVLNTNFDRSQSGVFTTRPEALTNDFFVNLLDMGTTWKSVSAHEDLFEGSDRLTGEVKWTGTRVDLIFGSNSELRALAEVYGCSDSQGKFLKNFVAAWTKVMNLDRFDLA